MLFRRVKETVPESSELRVETGHCRPVGAFCLTCAWQSHNWLDLWQRWSPQTPVLYPDLCTRFPPLLLLCLHMLCSAFISEPVRLLLALQGSCCRDSCWWAGERHLFYCPHRRETINAFLLPTNPPPVHCKRKEKRRKKRMETAHASDNSYTMKTLRACVANSSLKRLR